MVVAGGERPPYDRGFYVAPTLLADCTNDMRVAREEIFGPVVTVIPSTTRRRASRWPTTASTGSSTTSGPAMWPARSGSPGGYGRAGWA